MKSPQQTFLAVAVIITQIVFSSTTPNVHATLDQTLPEPLIKSEKLLPEEADGPYQHWKDHNKYFLVVAVNETGLLKIDLPFTQADATEIAKALTGLGYQPLIEDEPILTGKAATRSAIIKAVKTSHQENHDQDIIAIYVTGHASAGTKDLWLQTYGQEELGVGQGIPLSELVTQTRFKEGEAAFEGELVIILDTCFSGQGALSQSLTLGKIGRNTTVFSNSTSKQESCPLNAPDFPKMSAFTYSLLQAMGPQWGKADRDGDGILRYAEIKTFSKNHLQELRKSKRVDGLMEPELFNASQEQFLAYRRDQVRALNTPYRIALQTEEVSKALAASLQTLGANPKEKPKVPKDAQALAQGLEPEPDDFYAQAIQATAEIRLNDARELFVKADQQSSRDREQAEQKKQNDLYLARARMESYDGKFTEAFSWYLQAANLAPSSDLDLINEIGIAGIRAGNYSEAEPYLMQALEQREQRLSPDDPVLATSLNNLAFLYKTQGKYADAEPLYRRVVKVFETALGVDHPNVATALNNLALLYKTQGKYADAEPLYRRVVKVFETALGIDHPNVATALNNLASLYQAQGKYADAEPLYHRALTIDEAALGADHPSVAIRLNNLALLYKTQGKYADAEPLYRRVVKVFETALGVDHPNVATALNNLASLYQAQGKYADAEPLYHRALTIDEAALGADHPDVAIRLNNLAGLYQAQGKYADAEPLYHHALSISERALGAEHLQVALSLNNLAELYKAQGKYADAEPLFQRSYWIFYDRLGAKHPYVQRSYASYQGFLKSSGQAFDEDTVVRKLQQAITSINAQTKTDPASSTKDQKEP